MPASKRRPQNLTVLLVEADVIIRFCIAEYLRACDLAVIEAVSADDAKAILVAGPTIDMLISDAQLAGEGSGFVLAQWVRRHRPGVEVMLTASLSSKAETASEIVARLPECKPSSDAPGLVAKLNAMLAQRKRRLRQAPRSASGRAPKRKHV